MLDEGGQLEKMWQEAQLKFGEESQEALDALKTLAEKHLFEQNFDKAEAYFNSLLDLGSRLQENRANFIRLTSQKLAWTYFLKGIDSSKLAETYLLKALDSAEQIELADEQVEAMCQSLRSLVYFYLVNNNLQDAEKNVLKLLDIYQKKQATSYAVAYCLISLSVINQLQDDSNTSKDFSAKASEIIRDKCAIGYMVDFLSLAELINIYVSQERMLEAFDIVTCSMLEEEDSHWSNNPVAGTALGKLAEYFRGQKKFKQAEGLYKRSLVINEKNYSTNKAKLAELSLNLGNMLLSLKKYGEAEQHIKNAMKWRVSLRGAECPTVAACIETYATLLRKTKRQSLANKLDMRAKDIRVACVSRLEK